ncbi:helix-turn-helix domain-containing protein [Sphaerotilus sp.]|uniref:helix-turn-helix domain-containing protein n=1 Tax=Sphaerotilus sp. TaxID=2093942 RepID=UPI00286DBB4F|nr:helix-turn-helix domain-containing protein [Sphaerotilus sp.]
MSSHVQVIEQDGKPAFYVVPAALWERMREAAEDAEDIADLERFEREDDGVRYPAAVAMAMADGASPLRAWREHKAMTLQVLADAAGLSRAYVSQIEGGKRTGSAATLAKLAQALGVSVAGLIR